MTRVQVKLSVFASCRKMHCVVHKSAQRRRTKILYQHWSLQCSVSQIVGHAPKGGHDAMLEGPYITVYIDI